MTTRESWSARASSKRTRESKISSAENSSGPTHLRKRAVNGRWSLRKSLRSWKNDRSQLSIIVMNKFALGCGVLIAILLFVVVVAAIAIGGSYNRLVRLQQAVDQSWAQGQLSNALSRLLLVSERYPELKANQNFLSLQAQLEGTENRISVERGNFNKTVQDYNVAVRSFPTNFVAGMLGFAPRPFFTAQPGAEKPPPVQFNFGTPAPAPAATAAP